MDASRRVVAPRLVSTKPGQGQWRLDSESEPRMLSSSSCIVMSLDEANFRQRPPYEEPPLARSKNSCISSIGSGNTTVEFFSVAISVRVCR